MIVLRDLCKTFTLQGQRKVVADYINVTFPSKTSVGLLGRNGAGKSTLLRLIAGTSDPTSGEILSTGTISFPVGFGGSFHPDLTGEQNTRFVARIYGADTEAMIDYVQSFAELGPHFYLPLRSYSSGMRSRLSFGVSMGLNFDTYLIDEVTAVGDSGFKKKSSAVFKERMQHSAGIFVSHSLGIVREMCSAGAVLENGKLTYFADVEEAIERHNFNMDGPRAKVVAAVRDAAISIDPETDEPTSFPVDARMVFCIGAQYAGVDWLWDYMRRHRACHFPQKRELHYFDILEGHANKTLRRRQRALATLTERIDVGKIEENKRTLQQLEEETALLSIYTGVTDSAEPHRPYLEYLLRGRRNQQLVCDFTPTYGYLKRKDFAQMAEIGTARFIFVLRDPVDRLWAQIEADIPRDLPAAERSKTAVQVARGMIDSGKLLTLLDVDYSRTLTELEAAVLPSRIRYMFYEHLAEQEGLDGLCSFLGVSPQPATTPPDTTAALPIPTRIKRDLRQTLEPVYEAMRARFGADLPETWRRGRAARLAGDTAGTAAEGAADETTDEMTDTGTNGATDGATNGTEQAATDRAQDVAEDAVATGVEIGGTALAATKPEA